MCVYVCIVIVCVCVYCHCVFEYMYVDKNEKVYLPRNSDTIVA